MCKVRVVVVEVVVMDLHFMVFAGVSIDEVFLSFFSEMLKMILMIMIYYQ